jgi:citronellol/citronellal dehydrogenase
MDVHGAEAIWRTFAPGALTGTTALVTGGGSGIGRATARLLAYLGVAVAIVGRTPEGLARTAADIADDGGPAVLCLPCDVREPEQVDVVLDRALDELGQLDALVNNAGGQFIAPAEAVSVKGFRAVTRLNFDAVWYLTTRVAARAMIPAKSGAIVSITMTPRRGMPGMAHSSAARAAVESLTSTLAQEWAQYGIRLAAVAPGIVHTEGWGANYRLDPAAVASVVPMGRLQQPEEVAALIGFLLSPLGASITGQTFVADGGYELLGPANALQAALTAAGQRARG